MARSKTVSTGAQVTRFGAVGIMNTVLDYAIYITLTKIFSIPLDRVWLAKLVSGTVAMFNSFYFNRRWVFKPSGVHRSGADRQQFVRFVVATLVGVYVIQLGLVQFFTAQFPEIGKLFFNLATAIGLVGLFPRILTEAFIIKTVAFGLATAASMTWNFIIYKVWAFK